MSRSSNNVGAPRGSGRSRPLRAGPSGARRRGPGPATAAGTRLAPQRPLRFAGQATAEWSTPQAAPAGRARTNRAGEQANDAPARPRRPDQPTRRAHRLRRAKRSPLRRASALVLACALGLLAVLYFTNRLPWQSIAQSGVQVDAITIDPGGDPSAAAANRLLRDGALDPQGYAQMRRQLEVERLRALEPRSDAPHL